MTQQEFGRYLLLDKIASGGMAEVFRAKLCGESGFERIVAIKKILPKVAQDKDFITMFTDEAKITVQLQHSNIGQCYEFNKVDDLYYISMEYISGKDLKSVWKYHVQNKLLLPVQLSAYIVQKMSDGLDYAHRKCDNFGQSLGIIHRDVSPQNVILSWDGEVKVIDFGIAKAADKTGHTQAGILKGKFAYMAPEQIRGLTLDQRSDVFALGVVMYEMVTGRRAFTGKSEFEVLEKVRSVKIQPPSVLHPGLDPEVERIILKALHVDREQRYQYASELSEDLQRYLLMKGNPPKRHILGGYLQKLFESEHAKERSRLESYKKIEWKAPEVVSKKTEAAPELDHAELMKQTGQFLAQKVFQANPGMMSGAFPTINESGSYPGFNASGSELYGTNGAPLATHNAMESSDRTPTHSSFSQAHQMTQSGTNPAVPVAAKKMSRTLIAGAVGALVVVALVAFLVLKPKTGGLSVIVEGALSASVELDGIIIGKASPSLTVQDIAAGQHAIMIKAKNYVVYSEYVEISENEMFSMKATLERSPGVYIVSSEPPGAEIWLDGKKTAMTTPAEVKAVGGLSHLLELRLENYHTQKVQKKVQIGESLDVNFILLPTKLNIEVVTIPDGADLYMNQVKVGKTPFTFEYDPKLPYPKIQVRRKSCRKMETTLPLDKSKSNERFVFTLSCR